MLSGEIEPGDKVRVDVADDDLKFDVEKGGASREVADWVEASPASQALEPTTAR